MLATLLGARRSPSRSAWSPATTAAGATRSSRASTDVLLAFPFLILAVGLAAILGPSLRNAVDRARHRPRSRGSCASPAARRSSLREQDFVARGDRQRRRRRRRSCAATSCPNMTSTLLVQATVRDPAAIIGEAVLSFLGLGVQPPTPSWGAMLAAAQPFLTHGALAGDLPRPGDLPRHARRSTCSATACATSSTRGATRLMPPLLEVARPHASGSTTDDGAGAGGRRRRRSTSSEGEVARDRRRVGLRQERDRDVAARPAAAARRRSTGSARLRRRRPARRRPSALRDIRGREISIVFQEPMTSLNPVFTVGRQIGEVLRRHLGMSQARRPRADRRAARPRRHPGARAARRRVPAPALGRHAPARDDRDGDRLRARSVLIADEPTTALDVTIQAGVLDVLRELRERLGHGDRADHARPRRGRRHRRPRRGHVRGPEGRGGAGRRAVRPTRSTRTRSGCSGAVPRAARRARRGLQEIPGMRPVARPSRPADVRVRSRAARAPTSAAARRGPAARGGTPRHLVACFHPGRATTERRERPVLEVDGLRQALRRRAAGGGASCARSTASSLHDRAGRGRRAGRRVGQRQVDGRQLRPAPARAHGRHDHAQRAPTSRTCRAARCGRCGARCTWSSRTRTPR